MKSIGICVGSSNISMVLLEKNNEKIIEIKNKIIPHDGNPREVLKKLVLSENAVTFDSVVFTGRKMRNFINGSSISEPEAIEYAYKAFNEVENKPKVLVSAGGEMFVVYKIDKNGKVVDIFSGNKCASGTGEFFLQQLKRMDINVEEAIKIADKEKPYKVSGRCSVFCKSDCTHALNKGAGKEKIVSGLCEMMAGKAIELIKAAKTEEVMLIGGLAKNDVMVHFIEREIKKIVLPENADRFEAYGAALWGFENKSQKINDIKNLFNNKESSFSKLEPIYKFSSMVEFKEIKKMEVRKNAEYIIGIDVGSTTTKAVLLDIEKDSVVASCYLRTNGDPVGAARECYKNILEQVGNSLKVIGLGVTGSGRNVVGIHAKTDGIINEIIAHATAAAFFDKDVDTIFEIGGQDAKYTFLTNGVASDYAMNEACSAGTGSFLEESAYESLGIMTKEIGDIAMAGENPPNFSEQCSAFISSDIKRAIQEGMSKEDITAGLVYSIGLNYINRVKGNRAVGKKIFMQGGVCYNKAIPIAMAALTGKNIIVPPDPGLMGAFGVALDIKNKIENGLLDREEFDINALSNLEVKYQDPFICAGGKEKCDMKCKINRIEMEGKVFPFGGACNKYYTSLKNLKDIDRNEFDLVQLREKLLFGKYGKEFILNSNKKNGKSIGINNSLLVNTLFPLYYNFFKSLGFDVVVSENVKRDGIDKKGAPFCYPVEIAHGMMEDLLEKNPDYYFLPHVKSLPVMKSGISVTCPFVQSEPYYLKSAFSHLNSENLIDEFFEFADGYEKEKKKFVKIALRLGCLKKDGETAFETAVAAQNGFHSECKKIGKEVLAKIEEDDDKFGVVVFGRPYNALAKVANMGIPAKFASKGYYTIPVDFLPYKEKELKSNMYWAMGRIILKGGKIVKESEKLFGVYISNFSCGPDSFVIGDFRKIMDSKPSLTLELDSHTADAGVETRIEAFLDIVKSYIEVNKNKKISDTEFKTAEIISEGKKITIIDSNGKKHGIRDKNVRVVFPTLGKIGNKFIAAAMKYRGINALPLEEPSKRELSQGKNVSLCKECMPLMLTTGSLITYIEDKRPKDEITLYFMPETAGPCRFGQYNNFVKNYLEKEKIENVALLSLSADNGYAGVGTRFALRAWQGIIIDEVLEEIYSNLIILANNKEKAMEIYNKEVDKIIDALSTQKWKEVKKVLKKSVEELSKIELKMKLEDAKKVALVGEIYVRRDSFSKSDLVEKLAEKNIILKVAPASEWIYYCDYIVKKRLSSGSTEMDKYRTIMITWFKEHFEKRIKNIFGALEFYEPHFIDIEKIITTAKDIISPKLTGESVLTVGAAINDIISEVSGIINIGPFGCMPSRIAEAILNEKLEDRKIEMCEKEPHYKKIVEEFEHLPFLTIEVDGAPFTQLVEAKLDSFYLQVDRVHNSTKNIRQ